MKLKSTIAPLLVAAALPLLAASPQSQQQPQGQPAATPQADKAQLPKGQMPVLGRATKSDDPMPLFNFEEYFPGKWTFEWEVPESVLGPAGTISGTTVYRALPAGFYEADTQAKGPEGSFTVHEVFGYLRENKAAARQVTDSRGFSYMQVAKVGGDLGGYFNMYFESAPFVYKGKTLRIRNGLRLLSPVQYRNVVTLSVDGGPFTNMSDPWWKKDMSATTAR
jgi:hypothetical protein